MKTTPELQARLERLKSGIGPQPLAHDVIELIEEVLRLRERIAAMTPPPRVEITPEQRKQYDEIFRVKGGPSKPVKWITGKPYRNE